MINPHREKVRKLVRRLPKNNQHGFTLIELLVVISILGILAAVVTMSMVGITKVAQDNAARTELQTVQIAMDTMLADQGVPSGHECDGATGTNVGSDAQNTALTTATDMSTFPSGTAWTGTGLHQPVALYPHYLRQQKTHGHYHVVVSGTDCQSGRIVQDTYTP